MIPKASKQFLDWVDSRVETKYPRATGKLDRRAVLRENDVALEREAARNTLLDLWPVVNALLAAVEDGTGTSYNSEDDDIGERTCCHVVSYHNHLEDCWYLKAEATIKELGLPAGLYATP